MGTVILAVLWIPAALFAVAEGVVVAGGGILTGGHILTAVLIGLFLSVATIGIGFLPIWIALARRHQDKTAIVLLNVFTDWTVIGWIGALVWSVTGVRRAPWER